MSFEDFTQAQYSQSYYEYLAQKESGEPETEGEITQEEGSGSGSQNDHSPDPEPPHKRQQLSAPATGEFSGHSRSVKSKSVVPKRLSYSSSGGAKTTPTARGSSLRKGASATPSATLSAMKRGFSNAYNRMTPASHPADDLKTGHKSLNEPILEILSQVKKTNERLGDVEKRLQQLEEMAHSSSVTTSGGDAPKITIPTRVRHLVRDVYKCLLDDPEQEFDGFDLKKRYSDPSNQSVVKKVIIETKGMDGSMTTSQIQGAARRFFQSMSEKSAQEEKGTYDHKVQVQRRRNRIASKLAARKVTLAKVDVPEERKTRWMEILVKSFMSSEESGDEELPDGSTRPVMFVKPLPWRHPKVNKFLSQLTAINDKGKSKRAVQQTLPRVQGETSSRPKPAEFSDTFWGFGK